MKRVINGCAFALIALVASQAHAGCYGSEQLQTCYDASGNSYTVQRVGSQTWVHGYSASTGSTWSQNSTTIGSTTYTQGLDHRGRPWNETTTRIGNTVINQGMDADGRPFSSYDYADDDE